MSTPCLPCAEAVLNVQTGSFNGACLSCTERHLAQSQMYWHSHRARDISAAYRTALQQAFGVDWLAAHERVKVWAERIKQARTL